MRNLGIIFDQFLSFDDYVSSVCRSTHFHLILRLQIIQNQAARILTKTPRRDHITEVLIDLHWLKIEERIVYKLLILRLLFIVLPHCTCVN